MKFNEKLIELRKKEGLSQEELGYKLNVTRQTVSKWELGQTTPEMDKLVELGKIFNVSVDDLINDSETTTNVNPTIEEQPIEKQGGREKIIKIILVGALVIIIVLIAIKLSNIISKKWNEIQEKNAQEQEKITQQEEKREERQDKIYDVIFDAFDNIDQPTENYNETGEEIISQFEVTRFNQAFDLLNGTNKGIFVTNILDNIITSNKTEDRKIKVKYQETETQDEAEIKDIKQKIKTMNDYEVTFEYDEEGFINKAIIENL